MSAEHAHPVISAYPAWGLHTFVLSPDQDPVHQARVHGEYDLWLALPLLQEAAMEKAKAGEGRNVEHVALEDDATLALATSQQPKRRKRKQTPEAEQVWQAGL